MKITLKHFSLASAILISIWSVWTIVRYILSWCYVNILESQPIGRILVFNGMNLFQSASLLLLCMGVFFCYEQLPKPTKKLRNIIIACMVGASVCIGLRLNWMFCIGSNVNLFAFLRICTIVVLCTFSWLFYRHVGAEQAEQLSDKQQLKLHSWSLVGGILWLLDIVVVCVVYGLWYFSLLGCNIWYFYNVFRCLFILCTICMVIMGEIYIYRSNKFSI